MFHELANSTVINRIKVIRNSRFGLCADDSARAWLLLVLASIGMLLVCGCEGPRATSIPSRMIGRTPPTLAVGDVVKLTFPGTPELDHTQRIRSDGRITLPLIGETTATGKRVGTLQEELKELYKSKLQNKDVWVTLETTAIPVYVSGAVGRPGKVTLDRTMTVLEAIMEASGFTNRANPGKVVLVRQADGHHFTKTLDLRPALKGQSVEAFYLKPYDVIVVPESFF
jgi:polysaccharide export outer membrane protein